MNSDDNNKLSCYLQKDLEIIINSKETPVSNSQDNQISLCGEPPERQLMIDSLTNKRNLPLEKESIELSIFPIHIEKQKTDFNASIDEPPYVSYIPVGKNCDYPPKTLIKIRYEIVKKLNSSLFGAAYKCYDKHTDKYVVIKFSKTHYMKNNVSKDGVRVLEDVYKEKDILTYLNQTPNKYVVKLLDTFNSNLDDILIPNVNLTPNVNLEKETDITKNVNPEKYKTNYEEYCMVFEYVNQGDLYDWLIKYGNFLSNTQRKDIFKKICLGIKYIHDKNVAHSDISAENILIYSDLNEPHTHNKIYNIKIADFGLSVMKTVDAGNSYNWFILRNENLVRGKKSYISLEAYSKLSYNVPKSDIHSLGVLLYLIFSNFFP
jgi:serine/threonine protein kinase